MSLHDIFLRFQPRPGLAFPVNLALGSMLACLLLTAYAAGVSPDSAVRTHIFLQGMEMILISVSAAIMASGLHAIATVVEVSPQAGFPTSRRGAATH